MTKSNAALTSLAGKTALVTGASAGIGWATSIALGRHGANLVVTTRREERLRQLCAEIEPIGAKAIFYSGDAAEETTAQQSVALVRGVFGRLDIVINNAGAGNYKNLIDTSTEEYDALMGANMKSSFLFARHAVPPMIEQKSGILLFISSVAGLQGFAGEAVYSASKFAQVGFAQALDAELRKYGIKVGTICTDEVKTEFAVGKGRTEESVRSSHMMESHEVADAIVFACLQPPNVRIPQMTVRHMG